MHKTVWCAAVAIGLLGSSSILARPAAPAPEQSAQTRAPDHTAPAPPNAQPKNPEADLAKPAAVGPAQANSAGSMASETPPGATGQTMPSTISKENAALDKLPTTAMQFPLTDEQRKLVAKSAATAPKTETGTDLSKIHVAMFLPVGTQTQEFSGELLQQFPPAGRYKYVRTDDRILIVDPSNRTVVGEFKP